MGLASFYVVVNESARILTAFSCQLFGSDVKSKLRPPVTEGYTDLLVFALLSMLLFVLNWGFRKAVVEPVAARLLGVSSTRAKVQKFAQSSLEMMSYGLFSVFGALIVPGQDWFWPPTLGS